MAASSGIVFDADPRRPWLADRSARSLRGAGLAEVRIVCRGEALFPKGVGPTLLLRAGAWLRRFGPSQPPTPSATRRGVVAVGLPSGGVDVAAWRDARLRTGGDFSRESTLPPLVCAWIVGVDSPEIVSRLIAGADGQMDDVLRIVHWPAADANDDATRLRVVQVVTSLQRGGAERVAWDLHYALPACGVESALVTLGDPPRRALSTPPRHISLAGLNEENRAAQLGALAARFGADLLHAHLLRGDEARRMSAAAETPLVMTIHNTRPGWPEGIERLGRADAALLIACAKAVERELEENGPSLPIRTAWNGIDVDAFTSLLRRSDPRRLTIACVANPRPQKQLHRLPAVLAALRSRLRQDDDPREVRLILAGELPIGGAADVAAACLADIRREAESHGIIGHIEWTAGKREVRDVLAESDVAVSVSAHEGLSLALLEALAANVPIVATDVGGNAELAFGNSVITLVSPVAGAEIVADAVLAAAQSSVAAGAETVRRHFTREKMADRCAALYRAALGPKRGETFWFVSNNLSTGGAQSSLRRLARTLHARGRRVRVAVLQEWPDHPTPGRVDLEQAGISVSALPPAGEVGPNEAVDLLLAELRDEPPRAVTFWNALQSYKTLTADALLHAPVFDVSPGEMFYTSLDTYFAKPHPSLPYRTSKEYGRRLAGMIVKYAAEAPLAAERLGAPVHVIPNGVLLPELLTAPRPRGERLIVGTAARLHPHKRLEDLIDAYRLALPRLPPSELRIAGAPDAGCDDYAVELRERSADMPIVWLGGVTDVATFHAGLDCFAMISEPAGCPNASLEAMAAGLPVVATDVGGAAEQVVDGRTGRIVPPSDAQVLADALTHLGACPERRAQMGKAGRERIARLFSLDRMADAYLAVLDED